MSQENTYIRFDWAMKHMLRDKSNFGILEGLISVLLNEEVKIVELLESESNQDSDMGKFSCFDIKAENIDSDIIIVKIRFMRYLHYLQRITLGINEVDFKRIDSGNKYKTIKYMTKI